MLRIVSEMNTGYRTPEELRALLSRLTGRTVDESVVVFPPFYSEFGKNLRLGKNIFINQGCSFQDTDGITIGDGTLIGHGSTLTTLNHSVDPDRRADMIPATAPSSEPARSSPRTSPPTRSSPACPLGGCGGPGSTPEPRRCRQPRCFRSAASTSSWRSRNGEWPVRSSTSSR